MSNQSLVDEQTDRDLIATAKTTRLPLYNDLGFVELVDMMPRLVPRDRTADIAISRNARVSYAQGDKTPAEDESLVRYLSENYHTSPSESVVFQFRIRCPIFVERQLIRHRTARVNEQSFRYIVPREQFYYPGLRMQALDNKQGSSDQHDTPEEAIKLWREVCSDTHSLYAKYERLISLGVAREVARTCLPVSLMTELMWQMDLHNLLNFLRLRMDAHAQREIRELATAIFELIDPLVPVSVEAFRDFRLDQISFNRDEQKHIAGVAALTGRKKNVVVAKLQRLGINAHSDDFNNRPQNREYSNPNC